MKKLFTRIFVLCFAGIIAVSPAGAAVKEKAFSNYQNQLPAEIQKDINNTKKIGKIVDDIIDHGDLDQLYWLSQEWIGLDISTINSSSLYTYYNWGRRIICQIVQQDSIFASIHDGRNVFSTFYSSFYPRSDTRTQLIEEAEMLKVLMNFRQKDQMLQRLSEPMLTYARSIYNEERHIQIHLVERMLFGSDRYSCAHISPAPNEQITKPIADLLGEEVLTDPTRLPEKISALPEDKDNALLAILENILIYESYYLSSYDQNAIFQRIGIAATRQGVLEKTVNGVFGFIERFFPSQYKVRSEQMEDVKSNIGKGNDMLNEFIAYQDSLRRNGFMFVDYPLQTMPYEWQEGKEWDRYLERYLRLGYALCKEIIQGNGYDYIVGKADDIRFFLKTMGYYHFSLSDDITWQGRFVLYICDLNGTTQNWYYYTHESWAIGAAMAEHAVLTELLKYHSGDQMYEQLIRSASFFYSALNNEEATKNILEGYIFPVLPEANLISRDKEWNCYHMWYYACVLPYSYLIYTGDKKEEYGKFYSDRLLRAVRYNKKCENNAQALSALAEYYYNVDSIALGDQLLEEYFTLTNDSSSYYGYRFATNYWITHDYVTATKAADIVNQYDPTAMGSWYNEGCLSPSRAYALAGREKDAIEQLGYFNDFMRKEIGKQLMSVGAEQASKMLKRYDAINDRFVMICEDSISSKMKDLYMESFYNWQLQSKGLLLALNTEADSLMAHHPDSNIRNLYQRSKQREKALADVTDMNSMEAVTLQYNLMQAKNNLQTAIQEYIDKNGFEGVNQANWKDVRGALKDGQVAIEIVNGKIGEDSIPVYYALLLRRDAEAPVAIRLFSEEEVSSLTSTRGKENIHNIYSYDAKGQKLTQTIWGAILPHIKQGEVVFFSPSGILHQVAMENLPYDETSTIGDKYNLVRLSSTREIIGGKRADSHQNAALFGDIRYNATPTDLAVEHQKYESQHNSTDLAMANIQRMTLRDMAYDLPGTKIEVDSIEFMLKQKHVRVNTYRGRSATEESFKALSGQGKNILHLATHGFYWPEKEAQQQKFFTQNSTIESDVQQALPIDPLNRCGLLFAGANTALGGHSNRLDKGVQDGILTAKEISALDLRGADIVVLSACETGLGDVSGEGVFGLQRAFKIAGAQTMLMALWKVDDDATRMLTTAFYRYYSQGMSKRQAFRMAQQEVRNYTAEGTVSGSRGTSGKEKMLNKGKMGGHAPQPPKGGGSVTGDGLRVTEEAPQPPKGGAESSEVSHPYASPYYWAGFILLD